MINLNVTSNATANMGLRKTTSLDLAFLIDCTGSMRPYIESATQSVKDIVADIDNVEHVKVRLALIEFRDHSSQEDTFLLVKHDFTDSVQHQYERLQKCTASGGGDEPEAVECALKAAHELNWNVDRECAKVCILITDSPPHGIGARDDSMPNGCNRNVDPMKITDLISKKGILMYTVGCEPGLSLKSENYEDFYAGLAFKTGGLYVPLFNADLLRSVIVSGVREAISLNSIMQIVEVEVKQLRHRYPNNEEALSQAVHVLLVNKGIDTNQIKFDHSILDSASERAKKIARVGDLNELRRKFPEFSPSRGPAGPGPTPGGAGGPGGPGGASPLTTIDRSRIIGAPIDRSPLTTVDKSKYAKPAAGAWTSQHSPLTTIDRSRITYRQTERLVFKSAY